jgi:hypothetical protein
MLSGYFWAERDNGQIGRTRQRGVSDGNPHGRAKRHPLI